MTAFYALIPAAGNGSRMGLKIPKQYQMLAGRPLICHAVDVLCTHAHVAQVFVVLAPDDARFRQIDGLAHKERLSPLYCGGATRSASVLNGLMAMADVVESDDWVMVHDAARPCLTGALIDRLIDALAGETVGGLLAVPVADTLKRADEHDRNRIVATVPRENLWQAQTPQMFRYRLLLEAMRKAPLAGVTDEASAIEHMGLHPRLVLGSPGNLKVTWPEDIHLAETSLKSHRS